MKTYNKLMRIRHNGKLFDIFTDDNHVKVFLEVRIIDGKEKYFYLNVKDYFHLNNIYNVKSDICYYRNNNIYKFTYKVFLALGTGFITISSISPLINIINNSKLVRNSNFTSGSFENDNISDFEQSEEVYLDDELLEDIINMPNGEQTNNGDVSFDNNISDFEQSENLSETKISFEDVRKTLANNDQIPEKYRLYIEKFIDCVEEKLPQINLEMFNDNLKILKFDIKNETFIYGTAGAVSFASPSVRPLYLYSEYEDEQIEKSVIFHELTHILRRSFDESFCIINYGYVMSEAFTEIISDYLISDDYENYFNDIYKDYNSYSEYAKYLYQILKLLGNDYTLQDYFDYDVLKFEESLRKYGLFQIIELYDVDYQIYGDIEIVDRSKLFELEQTLLDLRVQQELQNGSDINSILGLLNLFDENNLESAFEFYNHIKNQYNINIDSNESLNVVPLFKNIEELQRLKNNGGLDYMIYQRAQQMVAGDSFIELANFVLNQEEKTNAWNYRLKEPSDSIEFPDGRKVTNPYFKLYKNNEIVYEGKCYTLNDEEVISNDINVLIDKTDPEAKYFLVRLTDQYICDYFTGEKIVLYDYSLKSLRDILPISYYDFEINLDNVFKNPYFLQCLGIIDEDTKNPIR